MCPRLPGSGVSAVVALGILCVASLAALVPCFVAAEGTQEDADPQSAVAGPGPADTTGVSLHARLERDIVPLDGTIALTVELVWDGGHFDLVVDGPQPPELTNLELTSSSVAQQSATRGPVPRTIRRHTFEMRPLALGMAYVEPLEITCTQPSSERSFVLATERLSVKVTEPAGRGGRAAWVLPIVVVAVVAVGVGGALALQKRHQGERGGAVEEERRRAISDPAQELRSALTHVERFRTVGDTKAFMTGVASAVRAYLVARYQIPVTVQLTTDILQELEGRVTSSPELLERVRSILERCDVGRYAPSRCSKEDMEAVLRDVESVIDLTK